MTMTGSLRRDERAVDNAQRGGALDDLGASLDVSSHYVLDDGAGPPSSPLAFLLAAVLAILGGTILVGAAGGYLLYRRMPGPLPVPASTLGPGDRLPLRVTGLRPDAGGRLSTSARRRATCSGSCCGPRCRRASTDPPTARPHGRPA